MEINNMFRTPETTEEIQKWIESHNQNDKIHLYTAMMMTWNLVAKSNMENKDKLIAEIRSAHNTIEEIYSSNTATLPDDMEGMEFMELVDIYCDLRGMQA